MSKRIALVRPEGYTLDLSLTHEGIHTWKHLQVGLVIVTILDHGLALDNVSPDVHFLAMPNAFFSRNG